MLPPYTADGREVAALLAGAGECDMVLMARGAGLVNRHYHPHQVFAYTADPRDVQRDRPAHLARRGRRPNGTFDVWKVGLPTGFVDRFIRWRASGQRVGAPPTAYPS